MQAIIPHSAHCELEICGLFFLFLLIHYKSLIPSLEFLVPWFFQFDIIVALSIKLFETKGTHVFASNKSFSLVLWYIAYQNSYCSFGKIELIIDWDECFTCGCWRGMELNFLIMQCLCICCTFLSESTKSLWQRIKSWALCLSFIPWYRCARLFHHAP
jgi:hypothetical protein